MRSTASSPTPRRADAAARRLGHTDRMSAVAGLRDLKKERARGAIVDAAIRLFEQRGIDATSMDDIAEQASIHRRRSARRALYDLADAVATIAERHANVVPYIAREMTHPDPARRRYAADRMQYPRLYESLLEELARAGALRSRTRIESYGRQLVDLTTGALVRAGNDFPVDALRAELRANVDVFWEGAVAPMV